MNDNDKFKKFFGFGGDSNEQEHAEGSNEPAMSEKEALEKAQAHIGEWADKYLSLTADFENYKKRVSSERTDWANDAQKRIILDLLAVIDNFERALEQEKKRESAEAQALLAGFTMIYQSLEKLLLACDTKAPCKIAKTFLDTPRKSFSTANSFLPS